MYSRKMELPGRFRSEVRYEEGGVIEEEEEEDDDDISCRYKLYYICCIFM